ncbi:hypothetical protein AJ80_03968 [Polytolypa hystricis UAMH7299]|uniref:Uncharacterized protein n=1 Tax=Polytolypa hystricis (strain UAMH7299) TaxID=1447883 RepID=A0A2B7YFT5_POLH7|nr:hypothetical protein AJ80_03968 [Polytolypa hystricis UAMH7299]
MAHLGSSMTTEPPLQVDEKGISGIPSSTPASPPSSMQTDSIVIPSKRRSQISLLTSAKPNSTRERTSMAPRIWSSPAVGRHAIPTSVAMLLEATSIPRPRKRSADRRLREPAVVDDENLDETLFETSKTELNDGNMTSKTLLDILLDSTDAFEDGKSIMGDEFSLSPRSSSLGSIPSLENDSTLSTPFSDPPTPPSLTQRTLLCRKQRLLSLCEDCAEDHPLRPSSPVNISLESTISVRPINEDKLRSSSHFPSLGAVFKSNLTASLRALKSAAQTVSNFTAPSVRSKDFLTRSLFAFNPELTDEKRPFLTRSPPSPALRRYLNPAPARPVDIQIYCESPRLSLTKPRSCRTSIQMQTYNWSDSGSPLDYYVANDQQQGGDSFVPRPREPRENGDFLRIIVLEINMRRQGKLRDDKPGRARMWLPPRQAVPVSKATLNSCDGVPSRWVGITIDQVV